MNNTYALAIHGGAGTIRPEKMNETKYKAYESALQAALQAGYSVLSKGGAALDAVEKAVGVMEDSPEFNAGRGSVFSHAGTHEMEASIMEGRSLEAGAVAGVRNVRNPITLARRVMDASDFVMMSGEGAEEFAKAQSLPFEPDEYFYSQLRYEQWQRAMTRERAVLDHTDSDDLGDKKFGTVGAVALDINGNLAAATSTGGLTNKKYGRMGDSPVIGAGTYANNKTCAVSCTGYGEYFLRAVVAYDVSCLMEYKGLTLREACGVVVMDKLVQMGGEGGLIAVDASGQPVLCFNSEGMYRGWVVKGKEPEVAIFK